MGNILFQNQNNSQNSGNSLINAINLMKSAGSSNQVFNQIYNNNPSFRQFADSVKGMSPEEAFRQNGLDFNQFRHMKW